MSEGSEESGRGANVSIMKDRPVSDHKGDYANPQEKADPFRVRYANGLIQDDGRWNEVAQVLAPENLNQILSADWQIEAKVLIAQPSLMPIIPLLQVHILF